jgi:hypothetical protein
MERNLQSEQNFWLVRPASFHLAFIVLAPPTSFPGRAAVHAFYGPVIGIVTDPTGTVIPGAHVTPTKTGSRNAGKSDKRNRWLSVLNQVAETHQFDVEIKGLVHFIRTAIDVQVATATHLGVTLPGRPGRLGGQLMPSSWN